MADQIRVLHVDDDPDLVELAATFLEREDDRITVATASNASAGLAHLADHEVDCVVSDHDMPGPNGIEFLETVRERIGEIPFILYTGKGSEAVASDAISAGVTDYLQKGGGTEQYEILAMRIVEAAEKCRIEREAERTRTHLRAITDHSMDGIITIDAESVIRFANPAVERLFGYSPAELVGKSLTVLMPEEERDPHRDGIERYLSTGERAMDWTAAEFPGQHRDGRELSLSVSFGEFEEDGECRFVGVVRDVTERDRHRAFIEHSSDIVSVLDEFGRFQYLSPSTERILGHTPEEMMGDDAFEYVHPDDREAIVETFEESLEHGSTSPTVEYRLRRADGEYQWVESIGTNLLDEYGVHGYVINTRDVSERKGREEKLSQLREWTKELNYTRTVEETARAAVDAADRIVGADLSGIHLLSDDGESLEPTALADPIEPFFQESPSYERGGAPGTRDALAWEALESDGPISIDEVSASDRLDEHSPAESLVIHPIGDHGIFVISASAPHAFTDTDVLIAEILANHLGTALDRVDRESRLERLHDATRNLIRAGSREEIAEQIVESAEEVLGFSVTTVRLYDEEAGGLVPVAVSDAVREILPTREVFTPDDGSLNWAAFESGEPQVYGDIESAGALDSGTGLESLMILPIGEHGTVSIGETEQDVFDGTDEFLAKILATAAETAFQSAARTRRLHQRSAELERQNGRLEEFTSVVSHDLRNPLNVAQGRVELARDDCESEHLDAATTAHERMDTLISDLLTLAREGDRVNETSPVRLSAVTEACWQTVETANATLTVDAEMTLRADESRLQQLLENLIRNAVEHGSERATVTVGHLDDGDGFFVEDDGSGIAAEQRSDVFEVGFSEAEGGSGFGLRIVEQVAEAHGWTVSVTDGRTGGARFEIAGVDVVE